MKKSTLLAAFTFLSAYLLQAQAPPYQWAKRAGAYNGEVANTIYVDGAGNSYITGTFYDTCRFGSITLLGASLNPSIYTDTYVAKYDPSGNPLWAKRGTSQVDDGGFAICADNSGNVYAAGYFNKYNSSTMTFGTLAPLASVGWDDIFLVKYDANGNEQWAVKAGGGQNDYAYDIVADNSGNIYVVGNCQASCTFGTNTINSSGWGDVYVAKYNASNGANIWTVKAGGSGNDEGYGIDIDGSGNLYITGFFTGTCTFGSVGTLTSSGLTDAFVAKLDPNGNFLWAKKGGGSQTDEGRGVMVDGAGNVFFTGAVDGNATFGTTTLNGLGGFDIFVAKYDASGNLIWVVGDGGQGNDRPYGICRDSQGGIYIAGSFEQTATFGTYPITVQGIIDVFTAKYDDNGNSLWALPGGAEDQDIAFGIGIDNSDKLYITGSFRVQAFFGVNLTASPYDEIFLVKIDNVLSVNDIEANNHYVQVYPNPVSAQVDVNIDAAFYSKNSNYEITDIAGKVIAAEKLAGTNSRIDLSQFPAGVYLLKIDTDKGTAVKQIIKQ